MVCTVRHRPASPLATPGLSVSNRPFLELPRASLSSCLKRYLFFFPIFGQILFLGTTTPHPSLLFFSESFSLPRTFRFLFVLRVHAWGRGFTYLDRKVIPRHPLPGFRRVHRVPIKPLVPADIGRLSSLTIFLFKPVRHDIPTMKRAMPEITSASFSSQ